jgi:voltage-gated hydrogen channel 1
VAVGAGEIQEDNARALAETKLALQEAHKRLQSATEENQQLRAQLRAYQQNTLPGTGQAKAAQAQFDSIPDEETDGTQWR